MRNIYDEASGLSYVPQVSRKADRKHSTLGEGLMIVGGFFLCVLAIIIAM